MQTIEINGKMPENVFDSKNVFCLFRQTKFGMGKWGNVRKKITAIFFR